MALLDAVLRSYFVYLLSHISDLLVVFISSFACFCALVTFYASQRRALEGVVPMVGRAWQGVLDGRNQAVIPAY